MVILLPLVGQGMGARAEAEVERVILEERVSKASVKWHSTEANQQARTDSPLPAST